MTAFIIVFIETVSFIFQIQQHYILLQDHHDVYM